MNRPVARLWAGALVLGAISQLHSAPVRLWFDSNHPPLEQQDAPSVRVAVAAAVDLSAPEFSERWVPEMATPSREIPSSGYASTGSAQRTLAIPLPPAVWPAGTTVGALAILAVVRKFRQRGAGR